MQTCLIALALQNNLATKHLGKTGELKFFWCVSLIILVVNDIKRNLCNVCTSDVYVQEGSVQLNEVWVSGSFDFSFMPNTTVSFESNTVFALGDVVQSINVDVINSGK